jgi:hypothetical protein
LQHVLIFNKPTASGVFPARTVGRLMKAARNVQ